MSDEPMELPVRKAAILRWHIGIVAAIHAGNVIALLLAYVADDFLGSDIIVRFLSVSSEGKLGTFFSGVTLLACSLLLGIIASAKRQKHEPYKARWALLSLIFLYIAFDEVTHVHEEIGPVFGYVLGVTGLLRGWVVPGMVCVVLVGLAYLQFLIDLPKRSRLLFFASGSVYIFGALGMEIVGILYRNSGPKDLGYGIIATVEEIFEMGGIVIFIYALLDYMERSVLRVAQLTFR